MEVIPVPALVWLVGPAGSGKSTWAARHFARNEVISSDALRAATGTGEHDLQASGDAFAVLETIASARIRRRLTTVVDTLGFDTELRTRLASLARAVGLPLVAVVFDTDGQICRRRNASRDRSVPAKVLNGQLRRYRQVRDMLPEEGWHLVVGEDAGGVEPDHVAGSVAARQRQAEDRAELEFFLHLPRFDRVDRGELRLWLADVARSAEDLGFGGISIMDHLLQIPQVGSHWEDMPESHTTLGYLAALTTRMRLSALVTNVTLRHPALLGRQLATLDVLSGGRVEAGLGAGWFAREHDVYGIPFPPPPHRLDLLEDTLRLLPVLWGPGGGRFEGKTITVPEAICYPRPLQERIPLVVGGRGERRTMHLAAELADGWNLSTSELSVLDQKLAVLRRHCEAVGRDLEDLSISVLDVTVCGRDRDSVHAAIERVRGNRSAAEVVATLHAATAEEHIGRYRLLAERGVRRVYVAFADDSGPGTLEVFARVVEAFHN